MNSTDIKSFLIDIPLTSTVLLATGWRSLLLARVQKVEIEKIPTFLFPEQQATS
jgi:hypothetical protein